MDIKQPLQGTTAAFNQRLTQHNQNTVQGENKQHQKQILHTNHNDNVTISKAGQSLSDKQESAIFDQNKVDSIKTSITSGVININAQSLANKIISDEQFA